MSVVRQHSVVTFFSSPTPSARPPFPGRASVDFVWCLGPKEGLAAIVSALMNAQILNRQIGDGGRPRWAVYDAARRCGDTQPELVMLANGD